ncbi:MAG: ABC transporter permease [Saprospiraceae bacterium]|nr:ABC transporter permease [Saprospiraceae bacterium]MBP9210090.1 ABC transporter permease [Saprospiraceae bacterium]
MPFAEILRMAWGNVRANLLRSSLTLVIIALGITALVGILTSIDGMIYSMSKNFSSLGANSFSIDRKSTEFRRNRRNQAYKESPPISYQQAELFKERLAEIGYVSLSLPASGNSIVQYAHLKTNPTTRVRGIDENYFRVTGYELLNGRSFSSQELESGMPRAILGAELVDRLFDGQPEKAPNKYILIGGQRYLVVGTCKSRGATMNEGADRRVFIPLNNAKREFGHAQSNYSIDVGMEDALQMDRAIEQSTGIFRVIRRLGPSEENDFEISKSDGIVEFLRENTVKLRAAAIAIGLMTLLGASIGLMNIMLVSVTERTREIGIAKALGATRRSIVTQFLAEAILICQAGGVVGVLLGIPVGNIVTLAIGSEFLIPWAWIALGLFVCMIVGILSGLYPALKAAHLDPVESLRYE